MEPNDMLLADPLDILFENRNKAYGAYTLRKYYVQRMYTAIGVTFSLVIVISFLILHFQKIPATVRIFKVPDPVFTPVDLVVKIKPVVFPSHPASARPVASQLFITPVITHQVIDVKPMATTEQLNTATIGATTVAGPPDDGGQHSGTTVTGAGSPTADSVEGENSVFTTAEKMPEFPGGQEALKRYLLKNLRMPDDNPEAGASIRVVARFVVGSDGKVRDIQIVQAAQDIFNNEVKRVISKMPDWQPGMQNHHPVAVYFSLPINFVNQE